MKKALLLISFIFTTVLTYAQEEELDLDVLRAPASPASNLLGTATTDIDKPTDLKSFVASIQSASNSYTKFPSNYAMDFAPFYIFDKQTDFTTEGLRSKEYKNIFKQTFVFSTAITKPDSTNTSLNYNSTYAAIGIKFSLCRGNYSEETDKKLASINDLQKKLNDLISMSVRDYLEQKDDAYMALIKKREDLFKNVINLPETEREGEIDRIISSDEFKQVDKEINDRFQEFIASGKQAEREDIKSKIEAIASDFQLERVGFSWDVNGGVSSEFRNNNFDNSKIHNAGLWTNFGYTTEGGIAFLGLVRYLYNPDKIYALDDTINEYDDLSTLDGGLRLVYSMSQSKFSCSLEAVYRSVLSDVEIDPTWKMLFNADYSLFKNQKLTFSFGKDFDGTVTKEGNLIAALTFIQGFGK